LITFPKKSPLPLLVKVSEVAKLLSVSKSTVHHLLDSGDLVGHKINPESKLRPHFRVTRASLLNFYQKRFGHSLIRALENQFEP
jgi:excisionase family DNA binding protein